VVATSLTAKGSTTTGSSVVSETYSIDAIDGNDYQVPAVSSKPYGLPTGGGGTSQIIIGSRTAKTLAFPSIQNLLEAPEGLSTGTELKYRPPITYTSIGATGSSEGSTVLMPQPTQIVSTLLSTRLNEDTITSLSIQMTTPYAPQTTQVVSTMTDLNSDGNTLTHLITTAVTTWVPRPSKVTSSALSTYTSRDTITSLNTIDVLPTLVTHL
jgi:hypothetical protein